MTLLVLDLRVPANDAAHSERDLRRDLRRVLVAPSPRLLIFLMRMTLGIFWIGQQTQLNQFARADRNLAQIHITFSAPSADPVFDLARCLHSRSHGACRLLVQYFAASAALCFFNIYYSIAAIVLVQVN
jgi:Endosomal/lysosomal potassium channel TMEM175